MIVANATRPYAWRPLRQLQGMFVLLLLGFLPIGSLLLEGSGPGIFVFAAVYGGLILFVQHQIISWKCPHCKRPFLRKRGTGPAMLHRTRCGHCGIRFGEQAKRQLS